MCKSYKKIQQFVLSLFLAGLLVFSLATLAEAKISLVFGTYAAEKPTATVRKLRPILDALEVQMAKISKQDVEIRLNISNSYMAAIGKLRNGDVDFVRFGQVVYVMAKAAEPGLKIIVVEGDHAKKSFKSLIVVRTDSPILKVADLSGVTFAFGSEYSTTGRYLPQSFLIDHGISADTLGGFAYLGRHDRVASAIADGLYDAGALSEGVYKELVAKGMKLRPIASFSSVTKPWVARKGLPEKTRNLITKSLLALRGIAVLGLIKKDCFLPGQDQDYRGIRQSIANNWVFFVGSRNQLPIGAGSRN